MELMRLFDSEEKPVAGICLGCQLLARAYGGRPRPLEALEFGFVQHRLTAAGIVDPLLKGLCLPPLMEFHEDTFDLPKTATLLMEGDDCPHQCFRVGAVSYGFQPHLEADDETVRQWIDMFANGEIAAYARHRQGFDDAFMRSLLDRLEPLTDESARYGDRVAENWLALTKKKQIFRLPGN
jgi:GMP synthase-like glutamine amidotransferase